MFDEAISIDSPIYEKPVRVLVLAQLEDSLVSRTMILLEKNETELTNDTRVVYMSNKAN